MQEVEYAEKWGISLLRLILLCEYAYGRNQNANWVGFLTGNNKVHVGYTLALQFLHLINFYVMYSARLL